MTDYITKDSGAREHFDSGMQRDTESGKARFDLMIPEGVPYEDQLLTRFALLLSRGAEKYDARNWEQATGEEEIARAKSSAFRHFMQWFCGERDEDHAVAVIFNMMVVETTRTKLDAEPETVEQDDGSLAEQWVSDYDIYHPPLPQKSIDEIVADVLSFGNLRVGDLKFDIGEIREPATRRFGDLTDFANPGLADAREFVATFEVDGSGETVDRRPEPVESSRGLTYPPVEDLRFD